MQIFFKKIEDFLFFFEFEKNENQFLYVLHKINENCLNGKVRAVFVVVVFVVVLLLLFFVFSVEEVEFGCMICACFCWRRQDYLTSIPAHPANHRAQGHPPYCLL